MILQIATVPCALLGLGGGFLYFGTQDIDPTKPLFGMDPMIMYGAGTVACAGVSILLLGLRR
jgi:import inner membrane translocase subunit TIM23